MDGKDFQGSTPKETQSLRDGASVNSSQHSVSTRSSRSSVSAAAARARAKAEAARARVAFAEREIAIKVDKARLEANLDALHLEKEAAAAIAQAEILEAAAEHEGEELHNRKSHPITVQGTHERVSDYVRDQATRISQQSESALNLSHEQQSKQPIRLTSQDSHKVLEEDGNQYAVGHASPMPFNSQLRSEIPQTSQIPHKSHSSVQLQSINAPHVKKEAILQGPGNDIWHQRPRSNAPQYAATSHAGRYPESSVMMDMAKYLARKELVSTGLSHFDDR